MWHPEQLHNCIIPTLTAKVITLKNLNYKSFVTPNSKPENPSHRGGCSPGPLRVPERTHPFNLRLYWALRGLGPSFWSLAVISLTAETNLSASAADMKNISILSPPIPNSSNNCLAYLTLSSAFKLPVS